MRLFVKKLAQGVLDLVFDKGPVGRMTIQANERLQDALACALQQFFCVTHIDKSARDDIRPRQWLPRLFIYGEHGQQYAVLCQYLAIAHDDLPHVTYPKAVYEDVAAGGVIYYLHAFRRDFDDIAILCQDNMVGRNTHRMGQLGMKYELAILTMDWHEELWVHHGQHQLQLFLGSMPRDVDIGDALVKNLCSLLEKVVDRAVNHFFVAGNRGC